MDLEQPAGAGRMILIGATLALALLWMDGWSHSVPVMTASALATLVVFFAFRNAEPAQHLTYAQRIERERAAASEWMQRHAESHDLSPRSTEHNDV